MLLYLVTVRAFGGVVALAWDPEAAPVVGYMIYYGSAAGSYSAKIDVGNRTSYTVSGLVDGATYHFAATAYDAAHTESGFSNDVAAAIPSGMPVAQFTASTTSGPAPLALNFLNTSTGAITNYAWGFGDGTTSTAQAPIHVYSAAGIYTVTLTATGPGGSNTQTRGNYLTVTTPSVPVAQFTGSPVSGVAPLAVSFTNSSTGSITSYGWTFGDGTTSTAANPSHSYAAAGVYTVTLNVKGPDGSSVETRTSYVSVAAVKRGKCPKNKAC